jgi:hypothetical protein
VEPVAAALPVAEAIAYTPEPVAVAVAVAAVAVAVVELAEVAAVVAPAPDYPNSVVARRPFSLLLLNLDSRVKCDTLEFS